MDFIKKNMKKIAAALLISIAGVLAGTTNIVSAVTNFAKDMVGMSNATSQPSE